MSRNAPPRLDLARGIAKEPGFLGVDVSPDSHVDLVRDLRTGRSPGPTRASPRPTARTSSSTSQPEWAQRSQQERMFALRRFHHVASEITALMTKR